MLKYCLVILMPNENQEKAEVGKYGLHKDSYDNGLGINALANTLNMVFGSTTFLHNHTHSTISRSPDGKTQRTELIKF
jgi:hypothetical protein